MLKLEINDNKQRIDYFISQQKQKASDKANFKIFKNKLK